MAFAAVSFLFALVTIFQFTSAGPSFTPFLPPSYPLAVRNPYFQAWLPGNQAANLPSASPQFWFGNTLGWSVIARVDGTAYALLGTPELKAASVTSGTFTSTHSIFTLTAGNANITLDFFSPVSFTNFDRQSLPFSYLTVTAAPLNGKTPSVQIYSDIDETWTGQSGSTVSSYTSSSSASVYQLKNSKQELYSQNANEQALWGEAVFATGTLHPVTAAVGNSGSTRGEFQSNGKLGGEQPTFAAGDVVALAHNLSTVSTSTSVMYAIGYVRQAAINYLGQAQTHYYQATYPDPITAVTHFISDYPAAAAESANLDAEIKNTGTAVAGSNYADILELSVIQTMGGIDVTISNSTRDTSQISAFIKEISSDGNVNTVDIIVELIPFFYIFNPDYLLYLLNPVVDYLETGRWPHPWTIHDIGTDYPNATGHDDGNAEQMPVEESGNLLIMAAVYQAATHDTSWTTQHSALFSSYANYLIANGLYPVNQLSTNDGLGSFTNMTQLGVKAAVSLSAWGAATSNTTLTTIGNHFASVINTVGVGTAISSVTKLPYFNLVYGSTTYFQLFNLYPARLLNLTCFPDSAYTGQSAFYPTVAGTYGIALDGSVNWGKTDWQLWSAAVATTTVRDQIISEIYAYISDGKNTPPLADRYYVSGSSAGDVTDANFRARPVLGAHFAVWALDVAEGAAAVGGSVSAASGTGKSSTTSSSTTTSGSSAKSYTGEGLVDVLEKEGQLLSALQSSSRIRRRSSSSRTEMVRSAKFRA